MTLLRTGGGVETPKKPTSSQLDNGEIAVNYHKGMERMFMKNDNDEVVEFVSKDETEANYYNKDDTDTLLAGKQNTINDIASIRSGAQAGATAVQPSEITPIDNRLDNVEYCLGDYLKEIYVFNWENHTTTTTEPIYTTTTLWTVDGNHSFRTFSCRLTAGSATISALYLGGMGNNDMMYFTQSGTVTMYLALYDRPSTTDNLIRVYDASGNTVKIISTYEVPYSSQNVCTPFTFEVEPGYYLKIVAKVAGVPELIWLGQIDFEIAGVKQIDKDVHANSAAIETIEQKIPEQASSSNQLSDKDFVNSSISTATATYRGAYNLVTDLSLTISATHTEIATSLATAIQTADNNDYCFVQIPVADATPTEFASVERYKFNNTAWEYEYTLNNSGYTAAQWAAINSSITSGLVEKLSALPTNSELITLLDDFVTGVSRQSNSSLEPLTKTNGIIKIPYVNYVSSDSTSFISSKGVYNGAIPRFGYEENDPISMANIIASPNCYYVATSDVDAVMLTIPSGDDNTYHWGDRIGMGFRVGSDGVTVGISSEDEPLVQNTPTSYKPNTYYEIIITFNGYVWVANGFEYRG